MTFESTVADGVLRVRRPGTRWLSTGWDGGVERADAAYNVTVPDGWTRSDIGPYLDRRGDRSPFDLDGPTLLTGVGMGHARGARIDPVVAFATVGLSNPAALPIEPSGAAARADGTDGDGDAPGGGTVNLVVGTTRALTDAALANLLAVVVEAKTATLLSLAGFPGTTTDAVVVGSAEDGEPATFSGSATPTGAAARACVREAVCASFRSRYRDREVPRTVAEADHGVATEAHAEVFTP